MSGRNFIQSLFLLLSILLLFISSYIYLRSIDRKIVFFFCNMILFVVIKQSIVEDEEPTKIGEAFDRENEKQSTHVAVSVELVEVENEEEGKMRVESDEKEPSNIGAAFDRGNEKKSHVVVSVMLVEVENAEEGKMRVEIDEKESEAKDVQERDELQEKIEAFIEKMKSQRRMEDLQLLTL